MNLNQKSQCYGDQREKDGPQTTMENGHQLLMERKPWLIQRIKAKWINAMDKEMESLYKNDVWELVELPKDRKAIGSKWVFKLKTDSDGSVERHKARLVVQGFLKSMVRNMTKRSRR